jgi:tripartite-type tricarboxylate transporter receptor subunit TctC
VLSIARSWCFLSIGGLLLANWPAAAQQAYPNRPIRLVVAFPPGGTADLVSRVFAQELSEKLGQTVVVENRPGAAGRIGAEAVMRSPADGYTLITAVTSSHGIAPALAKAFPYDPVKDFASVIKLGGSPMALVARNGFPASTAGELVAYAKANPGKINFASTGPGSFAHLAGELLKQAAGIDMTHVPYKGDSDAIKDLTSENVDIFFTPVARPQVEGKLIKVIGIAAVKRAAATPTWPTISETGGPALVLASWTGIMAPAGTPREIIDRLNALGNEVLALPSVRKRFDDLAYELGGGTPEAFAAEVGNEVARLKRLNETLKIQIQ